MFSFSNKTEKAISQIKFNVSIIETVSPNFCVNLKMEKTNFLLFFKRLGYGPRTLNTLSWVTGYPIYRVSMNPLEKTEKRRVEICVPNFITSTNGESHDGYLKTKNQKHFF